MKVKPYVMLLVLVLLCTSCARKENVGQNHAAKFSKKEVMCILVPEQTKWTRGETLTFLLLIVNGTDTTLRFDGRMLNHENITLMVRLPDSTGPLWVNNGLCLETFGPRGEKDIVALPPHGIYGTTLRIDSPDDIVADTHLKARPGRYVFWAEYHGFDAPDLKVKGLSLTSNRVEIAVE